jgi:hypothetical protein
VPAPIHTASSYLRKVIFFGDRIGAVGDFAVARPRGTRPPGLLGYVSARCYSLQAYAREYEDCARVASIELPLREAGESP